LGFFIGKVKPKLSQNISLSLIRYGIPISVMGLLLKVGINIDLIHSALMAFLTISLLIILINKVPEINMLFPNYSLQLGGLIGNTSFLGIPIAIALLPTDTINHTIGFDLGTTLFSWIFGPYLLQNTNNNIYYLNFKKLLISILNSPASRGIIGVLIIYLFGLDDVVGNFLWLPARFVISVAIIVVGTRLGIIANNKKISIQFEKNIQYSILLKLLILPVIIYLICQILNLQDKDTVALVLQAATPSAISTILMAEAYKINRDLAAKTLFITTIISFITIPLIVLFINF
tara:strand:+ start:2237 stop:3103 length:867 start_codon:yes stop_codon:yes gene_type:complete